MRRAIALLIDIAPAWLWKPANLRMIGRHTLHFCYADGGRRNVEWDDREIAAGRKPWLSGDQSASRAHESADPLREAWIQWKAMPYPNAQYPPGSFEGEVAGVDLALTDGEIGHIFWQFFSKGGLSDEDQRLLPLQIADMERAVSEMTEPGRSYFATALSLLRRIEAATGAE